MNPDQTPAHLPAPLPPAATLLHRAQGTLGLLREVVQESSAEYWYERGMAAIKPGTLDNAMNAFRQCLHRAPNNWRAALQLAIILASRTSEETVAMMGQALKPYYEGDISWDLWSSYYYDCPQANRQALHMGLELNLMSHGENPEIQLFLALMAKATYSSDAVSLFQRLATYHPNFANNSYAFNMHSGDNYFINDSTTAIQFYNRALEINPNSGSAYRERALAFKFSGEHEAAYQDYTKAIALNDFPALRYRALLFEEQGNYASAIEDINKFIDTNPSELSNYYIRAELKQKAGDDSGAGLDFKRAKAPKISS